MIAHQTMPVPGSVTGIDVRAQSPNGRYGGVMLRLDSGRYPAGPDEVAVTSTVASTFSLHVGRAWSDGGRTRRVVGTVENPLDLLDQFVVVAPGQADPPSQVSILANAGQKTFESLNLPSRLGINISTRGASDKTAHEALILVLGSLGLLFVGLIAVAGFTVMAQRRLRAFGMLGALGATDRHIRLVLLTNGAAVGTIAAGVGAGVGLVSWFAFAPTLQRIAEHRVDAFDLPWWAIAAAMALTLVTSVAAAWWPARAISRVSVVSALSGRPPRPRPAHRFAAVGGVVTGAGLILLAFAEQHRAGFILGGTVCTVVGLLLLTPIAIRSLALAARPAPVAVRLALRDLARYQARSGAALGAVTLAIGLAATIAISASASEKPTGAGNLPTEQILLHVSTAVPGDPVPPLSPSQQQLVSQRVTALASTIDATSVRPLFEAYRPGSELQPLSAAGVATVTAGQPVSGAQPGGYMTATLAKITKLAGGGEEISSPVTLYIATPTVLAAYGIRPNQIDATTDVISSRSDLGGLAFFGPDFSSSAPTPGAKPVRRNETEIRPKIQILHQLPQHTSGPSTLITNYGLHTLGLTALPSAWLLQATRPLSTAQIATAQKAAAAAGIYVETRTPKKSVAPLRNWSTAAGILVALGVLGMTVGLIRSETANDLRTLAATGASASTRRSLTAATASALGFLGAVLGTAGAYAALVAWHRSDLTSLQRVPSMNLIIILVGLPLIAATAGWLLAGREPPAVARRPLE